MHTLVAVRGRYPDRSSGTRSIRPAYALRRAGAMLLRCLIGLAMPTATAAQNQAPVNTMPVNFAASEDTPAALTGMSIADPDAGAGSMTVTFAVTSGSLTAASTATVKAAGTGTGTLVLTGTVANINTFLGSAARPSYMSALHGNGAVTLTMTTNDNGNTGTGGALTDVDTRTITVAPVNDLPFVDLDGYTPPATTLVTNGHFLGGSTASWALTEMAGPASGPLGMTNSITSSRTTAPAGASASGAVWFFADNDGSTGLSGVIMRNTTAITLTNGRSYTFAFDVQFLVEQPLAANFHWVLLNASNQAVMIVPGRYTTGGTGANPTSTPVPLGTWTEYQTTFQSGLPTAGYYLGLVWDTPITSNGNADDVAFDRIHLGEQVFNRSVTYTENDPGTAIAASAMQVIDPENTDLSWSIISLTNAQTGDRLLVNGSAAASGTLPNGITWTRTDTQVTLSGGFGPVQYTEALTFVQFNSTSDNPNTAVVRDVQVMVSDGSVSNIAHAYITVAATNDAPVANDNTGATLTEDGANGTVNIVTNDTDPDGNPTVPTNGAGQFTVDLDIATAGVQTSVTVANGVWTYNTTTGVVTCNPAANFYGSATLTYRLCDPAGACDDAVITFPVTNVNDAPVNGVPAAQTVAEDVPLVFSVANGNAVQIADEPGTVTVVLWSEHGTITLAGTTGLTMLNNTPGTRRFSGSLSDVNAALDGLVFTPTADNNGAGELFIRTTDSNGLSDQDVVAIDMTPVADGMNDVRSTAGGTPVTFDPRANDSSGPNGYISAVTAPANGTVTINGGTSVTYIANTGFIGSEVFNYTLTTVDPGFNYEYWTYNPTESNTFAGTFPSGFPATAANGSGWTPGISGAIGRLAGIQMNDGDGMLTLRWTGVFLVSTAGTYTFTQYADNAGRLIVDGTTRLTSGYGNGTVNTSFALAAGVHTFRVDYGDVGGNETIDITWSGPDTGGAPVNIGTGGRWGAATRTETATVKIDVGNTPPLVALTTPDLVTNGSFESGATGWTGNSGVEVNTVAAYGVPAAPSGTQVLEVEASALAPTSTRAYVAQSVATEVGRSYIWSIQAVSRGTNTGDAGILSVAGVDLLGLRLTNTWNTYAVAFTATTPTTEIRITSTGSTSGSVPLAGDGGGFIVDDVRVRAVDHTTSYTENAAGVALAMTTPFVYDLDNADLTGAVITLTAPQPGDRLLVNGSAAPSGTLGGGIAWTRTDDVITLSGSFTKAAYAAALPQLQFHNTSDDPTGAPLRDVTVVLTDGSGPSNTAHAYITVVPVNDPPQAENDLYNTPRNVPITAGSVRSNDDDVDDGTEQITWSLLNGGSAAANGTLDLDDDGTFTYTPNTGFLGTVSFTYAMCDHAALCDPATVTIDVYSALPVELLAFDGHHDGGVNHLTWSTASELNSERFEVERSSDAITFRTLGTRPAAGHSQHVQHYAWDDADPLPGVSHYRLKQVDLDGTWTYSGTITLHAEQDECTVLTLDPAGRYLVPCTWGDGTRAEVLDARGRSVPGAALLHASGCTVDLTGMPAALYMLRVWDGAMARTYKVMKP